MKKILMVLAIAFCLVFTIGLSANACYYCESDLIAGQNWDAGKVRVWTDADNLYVQFVGENGWAIGETHLYVGTAQPTHHAPGRFPYSGQTTYMIPLEDFGDPACWTSLYIAAHAVVSKCDQEETAWADTYGIPIGRGWAMYFEYVLCDGCVYPD